MGGSMQPLWLGHHLSVAVLLPRLLPVLHNQLPRNATKSGNKSRLKSNEALNIKEASENYELGVFEVNN